MNDWQAVNGTTQRIPVEDGWLYRTVAYNGNDLVSVAMCFVPSQEQIEVHIPTPEAL